MKNLIKATIIAAAIVSLSSASALAASANTGACRVLSDSQVRKLAVIKCKPLTYTWNKVEGESLFNQCIKDVVRNKREAEKERLIAKCPEFTKVSRTFWE